MATGESKKQMSFVECWVTPKGPGAHIAVPGTVVTFSHHSLRYGCKMFSVLVMSRVSQSVVMADGENTTVTILTM